MANEPYDTGYRKPPVDKRFKPGKSGNPTGRPKGRRNLKFQDDVADELSETIVITEGGRPKRITKQRALIKALFAKAMKGKAPKWLIREIKEVEAEMMTVSQELTRTQVTAAVRVAQAAMERLAERQRSNSEGRVNSTPNETALDNDPRACILEKDPIDWGPENIQPSVSGRDIVDP